MSKYVKDNEFGTKYPNFRKEEFKCPCCGSYGKGIATTLLDTLQALRNKYGNLIVTSGYRCSSYNKKVGGATNSFHVKGRAFDIVVKGYTPSEVAKYARSIGIKGVIEYNTFVHIDSRPKQYWARNNNGKVTLVK